MDGVDGLVAVADDEWSADWSWGGISGICDVESGIDG